MPHLLRCQGLAVKYYRFALGRLGSEASSAFATAGFNRSGPPDFRGDTGCVSGKLTQAEISGYAEAMDICTIGPFI